MKEDFLHYIWLHKKITLNQLFTTNKEKVEILHFGQYLQQTGPDIFNAQLIINNQKWAGNIEIHVKSSDWYLHNHENDSNYDNVILHVVWEHDTEIYRKDNSEIPVLELKNYVAAHELEKYNNLIRPKSWIYCENEIASINTSVFLNWQERLFFERLERKIIPFEQLQTENNSNWEATLFCMLAKNFGLNVNGQSFYDLAKTIPYQIIKKEAHEVENLEALFFGKANLLTENIQDSYAIDLKKRWLFIKHKYQLSDSYITPIQFFKLRPDNFPTVRLAQLAMLFYTKKSLFIELTLANTKEEMYAVFNNATSKYWENHYNFDKTSNLKPKKLSTAFIDLLLINTIIPIKFLYAKANGKDVAEELIALMQTFKPEKNTIIEKFDSLKITTTNAFETQSLLELKKEYCDNKKCLQCAIGLALLKK